MSSGRSLALLAGLALLALSRSSGSSSAPGTPGTPNTPGGPAGGSPEPTPPGSGGYPDAPRTGYSGPDAWRRWAREVHELARADVERAGGDVVDQQLAAHVAATLGLNETSGRAEYGYNVGNLRPVGSQPRARWPNGVLFRVFPTRADGVHSAVALFREGRRYREAYQQALALAREGEPLEPLVGALVATLHDLGYDEAPQRMAQGSPERLAWVLDRARTATRIADLVSRAIATSSPGGDEASQPATPSAVQTASQEIARAILANVSRPDAGTPTREVAQ